MFTILDYSSALEYSIIRRYTNIVYYIKYCILLLQSHASMSLTHLPLIQLHNVAFQSTVSPLFMSNVPHNSQISHCFFLYFITFHKVHFYYSHTIIISI